MFIVSLSYIAPLEAVDSLAEAHIAWLDQGYAAGTFLPSGRKNPRVGGVILAQGERAAVEALAQTDPFVVGGVALCEVTEVLLWRTAPGLEGLRP